MASKAQKVPHVGNLTRTTRGLSFTHASGQGFLPRGTPAYNCAMDLMRASEVHSLRLKEHQIADAAKRQAAWDKVKDQRMGVSFFDRFRRAAPASITVTSSPKGPAPIAKIDKMPNPLSPRPIGQSSFVRNRLAEKLGMLPEQAPATPAPKLITLSQWELKQCRGGMFLAGKVGGLAGFQDGSEVETPVAKFYDPPTDLITLSDGSLVNLASVKPGNERKQSVMLETLKRSLPLNPSFYNSRPEPSELAVIMATTKGPKLLFADGTATAPLPPSDAVSLIFTELKTELEDVGISMGLKAKSTPTPAAPAAKSAPAPAGPAHAHSTPAPGTPSPAPAAAPAASPSSAPASEEVPFDLVSAAADLEGAATGEHGGGVPDDPVPVMRPATQTPTPSVPVAVATEIKAGAETPDGIHVSIAKFYPPSETRETFAFRLLDEKGAPRNAVLPAQHERFVAALINGGVNLQATATLLGEKSADITVLRDSKGERIKWEDLPTLAEPHMAALAERLAPKPEIDPSSPDGKPVPQFLTFAPPEAGGGMEIS